MWCVDREKEFVTCAHAFYNLSLSNTSSTLHLPTPTGKGKGKKSNTAEVEKANPKDATNNQVKKCSECGSVVEGTFTAHYLTFNQ